MNLQSDSRCVRHDFQVWGLACEFLGESEGTSESTCHLGDEIVVPGQDLHLEDPKLRIDRVELIYYGLQSRVFLRRQLYQQWSIAVGGVDVELTSSMTWPMTYRYGKYSSLKFIWAGKSKQPFAAEEH